AAIKGLLLCGISLTALNDAFASFQTGPSARASLTDRRGGGIILAHVERGPHESRRLRARSEPSLERNDSPAESDCVRAAPPRSAPEPAFHRLAAGFFRARQRTAGAARDPAAGALARRRGTGR